MDKYDKKKDKKGVELDLTETAYPSHVKQKPKRQTAVALKESDNKRRAPTISAAGRGTVADKIIALAYENGIMVREDRTLAEMLAQIELDSPIPTEAFGAVAEILSYVYRASNQPNPFDAVLKSAMDDPDEKETEIKTE